MRQSRSCERPIERDVEPDLERAIELTWAVLDKKACTVDRSLFDPTVAVIIQGITGRAGRPTRNDATLWDSSCGGRAASGSAAVAPVPAFRFLPLAARPLQQTGARAASSWCRPLNAGGAVRGALRWRLWNSGVHQRRRASPDAVKLVRQAR